MFWKYSKIFKKFRKMYNFQKFKKIQKNIEIRIRVWNLQPKFNACTPPYTSISNKIAKIHHFSKNNEKGIINISNHGSISSSASSIRAQ